MEINTKHIIEAALFAADEPLGIDKLLLLFEGDTSLTAANIREALDSLTEDYADRGVELKQVASGYRFQAKENTASHLQKLWERKPARYSRAFLETLALIAYRQPISRGEIEEVRGVVVSTHIIKTLQEREWIKVVGHRDVPGKPELFGTTKQFLDYFNLKKLSDLPPLEELVDLEKLGEQLAQEMNTSPLIEQPQELAEDSAEALVE